MSCHPWRLAACSASMLGSWTPKACWQLPRSCSLHQWWVLQRACSSQCRTSCKPVAQLQFRVLEPSNVQFQSGSDQTQQNHNIGLLQGAMLEIRRPIPRIAVSANITFWRPSTFVLHIPGQMKCRWFNEKIGCQLNVLKGDHHDFSTIVTEPCLSVSSSRA